LVARFAAQLAAARGEGAVELVIPPGLLGQLLEAAVGLGGAEGLGGPVQIGLSERRRRSRAGGVPKGRSDLTETAESKMVVMAMAPFQPLLLASRVSLALAGPFLSVEANPRPDTLSIGIVC
jgi:hypothetical protein